MKSERIHTATPPGRLVRAAKLRMLLNVTGPESATLDPRLQYLTISEVAGLLRMTDRAIQKMALREDFPAIKIGRLWRIPRARFEAWLRGRHPARAWQISTGAALRSMSASAGEDRKSGDPLARLLAQRRKPSLPRSKTSIAN